LGQLGVKNILESTLTLFDSHHGINSGERWASTNINRVVADLIDLPYKPGYGSEFRMELLNDLDEPEKWLLLKVFFNVGGKIVDGWIVMIGYPRFPPALRLTSRPRCPIHGGPHSHVYPDGVLCWPSLMGEWSEWSDLYADYLRVVLEILNKPTEHIVCRR